MERLKLLSLLCLLLPVFAVVSDLHSWYRENDAFWKTEAETTRFMISSLEELWDRLAPGAPAQFKKAAQHQPWSSAAFSALRGPAPLVLIFPSVFFFVFYRLTLKADRKKAGAYQYKRD